MSGKRKPRKRKGLFNRGLVRLAAVAVIIGCTVLLIATELNEDWQAYISQEHIISYDLYYLGIAFYDEKRYREEHVINFY